MNSQDIFIKSNFNESTNDIIHLDLSDTNQNGGNADNNIIHLSLSSTIDKENIYKTGGRTDSSEYFNKLAEQIVSSKTISQNGGFNVITTIDESSEIFLSSETINDIKNVSMTGGTKNKKRILFDFNDLKKHLLKVSENLDGGSDSEEDDDVLNVDDSNDDDDKNEEEEIKKLFNDESDNSESLSEFIKEKKTVEEKIINKNDKKNVISLESHRSTAKQNKAKRSSNDDTDSDMESKSDSDSDSDSESEDLELDLEDDDDSDNDDKKNKEHKKKETKVDISDSVSLGGSSTEYQFSDSISSPKLVSYRKIENTLIGRRHL